jgi:hypothetical protein
MCAANREYNKFKSLMKACHFHVPGEAARREYAVYLIVARHRTSKRVSIYVGKTGDNREGCNPVISRAGNHFSFNRIHSQSRNLLGNPEEFDFDFFFTPFGQYVPPSKSRLGIDLVNEMERQLNRLVQDEFAQKKSVKIENPLKNSGYISKTEREKRSRFVTPERIAQLQQLLEQVRELLKTAPDS